MKKTYIEPKNTVVLLNTEKMVCESISYPDSPASSGGAGVDDVTLETGTQGLGREVINTPDAWEEW